MGPAALAARLVLAVVFGVAGAGKLADLGGSRSALEGFGVPRRVAAVGGVLLPVGELLVTVGLLVPATAWWAGAGAIALLLMFLVAISVSLARGQAPDCHCFGQVHSAPAGPGTLLRNAVLLAFAGVVLAAGQSRMLSAFGWVGQLSSAELVLAAVALVLAGVAVVQGWFLLQLFGQNGRILARLETLETQPGSGLLNGVMRGAHAGKGNGNGHVSGLTVGAQAPRFALPALDEQRVSLDALCSRGLPVLLVFSDPNCGPCSALLPEVGRWQREHSERLTIVLVSRGTVEQNTAKAQEHDLADVLLQHDREIAVAFQAHATPAAALVTVDGKIARSLARGPQAIRVLVDDATAADPLDVILTSGDSRAGNGAKHPAQPARLEAGAELPLLEWEDLDGRGISTRELHGTPTTLVFWNPRCGFCERLLPELKDWLDAQHDDEHQPIMISSGTTAENRALELSMPIVLDDAFQTGRLFGVGGTPSAVAIGADGRIAASPAVGGPAVLELLSSSSGWAGASR
jgi:peroxiredoxin